MMSLGILGIPLLLQKILDQLKIDILPVKNIAYFLAMNVALIAGFFKWLRGIEKHWEMYPSLSKNLNIGTCHWIN